MIEGSFQWNYDGREPVKATLAEFYLVEFEPTGEKSWSFSGETGTVEEENVFGYLLTAPYIDDNPLDRTYTIEEDLNCWHFHSIPAPPGFTAMRFIEADEAELAIRLDPTKGTVTGDFVCGFKVWCASTLLAPFR